MFQVGFFPSDCVEVIGDTVPQAMASKIPETPQKAGQCSEGWHIDLDPYYVVVAWSVKHVSASK